MFGFTKLTGTDASDLFAEFIGFFLVFGHLLFEAGKLLLGENQLQLQLASLVVDFATLGVNCIELSIMLLLDMCKRFVHLLSRGVSQSIRIALKYFDELI